MTISDFSFHMGETGKRISQLRRQSNMTQVELADRLGISFQAVSNWERGASMPDIAKLPELAQILHVSIDELLNSPAQAAVINKINAGQMEEIAGDDSISADDVAQTIPLLKPKQADELLSGWEKVFSVKNLCVMAPFVSKEVLGEMAKKGITVEKADELCGVAPFLSKKDLHDMAKELFTADNVGNLCAVAPFLSKEGLYDIAKGIITADNVGKLCALAPFLSKEGLYDIAKGVITAKNAGKLCALAPFLGKDDLIDIAKDTINADNMGVLNSIMPFVGKDVLNKIITDAFCGQSHGNPADK